MISRLASTFALAFLVAGGVAWAQPDLSATLLERSMDVGTVEVVGSSASDDGRVTIRGGGNDIWGASDAMHYVHGRVRGDFAVTVRVAELEGPAEWGKVGIMLRSSVDPDADNVAILLTVGGRVTAQYRSVVGDETTSVGRQRSTPDRWLRLIREGNRVQAWFSPNGSRWTLLREVEHLFPDEALVGLAITSHTRGALAEAVLEDLSATQDLHGLLNLDREAIGRYLHVTPEELAVWRERAENGPYRLPGDVSENSPGDWQRIVSRANDFLDRPDWRHWRGNPDERCYQRKDPAPHDEPATNIRDAAFVYLVTGDDRYRDAARDELLALASEPGTDFGNEDRWCTGAIRDINPGFEIANWFTKLLFAYDYLGEETFTATEHARLANWFIEAGHFFERELHYDLSANFPGRLDDDYRLSDSAMRRNASCSATSHHGGWEICSLAMYYNNRRATYARFAGLVGIKFDDGVLRDRAERFAREWILYSMYPDGTVGEFERWTSSLPDLGWDYAAVVHSSIVTLADHLARSGDPSLYEYVTTDGRFGTGGGDPPGKSLLSGIRNLQSYLLPSTKRYATDDRGRVGDSKVRIDGVHHPTGWDSAADVVIVPANLYYQDPDVRAIYTREAAGTRPYPSRVAPRGPDVPWTGDWGIYPGVLFMYGGLEGAVDPYP